jgi:UDP-N-acetylmuramoyl-tripeptide--D-alanyl-D-alanine ligase
VGRTESGPVTMTNATGKTCWTPPWVQSITGGRWLAPPTDADVVLTGLGIDSRTIKPGHIFLAVKGENFDGHAFIDTALNAGAAMAIIEREEAAPPAGAHGILLVDDTVQALQSLARSYRELLREAGCTVIAVAGSNGKTTTRHLIHTVLASRFKGTQSPKSFNNHLGVPLTVLGASVDDRFLVAEVGTNHPGEVDTLGKLLQPDAAVITSIGNEHMEFFIDLKGVAEEEAAITRHLPTNSKLFVESEAFAWVRKATTFNPSIQPVIYGFGEEAAHGQSRIKDGRQRFAISETESIDLPLLAQHDISNALAAVEVGRWMGIDDTAIKAALQRVRPMPGRLEIKRLGTVTVIDDTYNANPDSMRAALGVLADYPIEPTGRRVAVLGDMLELGDLSQDAHRDVGKALAAMSRANAVQEAVFVGPLMELANQEIARGALPLKVSHHTESDTETLNAIAETIRPGDVVLCKGSRVLQLERLLPVLKDRFIKPD